MLLEGDIETPTPCYSLEAQLLSQGTELTLLLVKKPVGEGACIQCVGSIPFRAEISNLSEKIYKVIVSFENNIVFEKTADLDELSKPPEGCGIFECGDGVCNKKNSVCPNYNETPQNCGADCRVETIKIKPNIPMQL